MRRYIREYGLGSLQLADDARDWLMGHDWPGNVRELQNLMERAVLLAGTGPIRPVHFLMDGQEWSPEDMSDEAASEPGAPGAPAISFEDGGRIPTIQEMEMHLILKSLDRTSGNRTKASELLGISVRTLRNKLGEYRKIGLEIP
jgi:DNA-binding NtrC family response regulator